MASATATTKSDAAAAPLREKQGILSSHIGRFIFLGNLLGLAILFAGVMWLSESRAQLIRSQMDSLAIQGEVVANVLAETATMGEPEPRLLEQRARAVLQRLRLPASTRVRLSAPDGRLIADTSLLGDHIEQRELEDLTTRQAAEAPWARVQAALREWRMTPWRADFTYPEEVALAAAGENVEGQRRGEAGQRVVSVSMPIQRVEAVIGVLTVEAGDVDAIIRAERRAMAPFMFTAALMTMLTSLLLAWRIAAPLRKLADWADRVRTTGLADLKLPTVPNRKDEIGELSRALEGMTASLKERIDSNERFAADVAHEIKNPLTSIRSAVETTRAVKDPEAREKLLGIIAQDVGRLDRLITDIARASYMEAETARGGGDVVDVGRLTADICETYAATRKENEAIVSFNGPPPEDARVFGQASPLGQVMRNLLDNAKSFSPPGGVVSVSIETERRKEGRFVRLIVADRGPGIPPANLEAIFRRFYTDRPKGAAFGGNSGLGLSIARQIVEAHNGRIWAENMQGLEPDKPLGARFIVELPSTSGS